ncbi:universal stress protein [Chitinophaga pinensis]|uniref:UspA domain protein n=1 Tax=Chitinophaga pinensis (strain ATCC 43595 / DSM 2588 / LMG 13176 / NBRC 15968 / NCIMB 11800 / UQM 2034) TaxID=485918 RepID=A0A979GUS8_CHIPD|nr:universal stress protein [Chitinophaga pinensis]ACU62958.1 UspA domain protein [Chitinophaga pinensis DSM 2588]
MKTLLIPVDFSATSDNAVNFAIEWARAYSYNRIILLKTFYDTVFDHIVVSAEYAPVSPHYMAREREEAAHRMENLSREIAIKTRGVDVISMVSEAPLLRAIMEVVREESPELIVLGSDNYRYSSGSFIAGNLISIAKASPVRVLIVPSTYQYQRVEKILVPADYKTLDSLDKVRNLQIPPQWKDSKLLVLNVDPKERYLNPDDHLKAAEQHVHERLKDYPHDICYSNDKNIINGILSFTQRTPVQLIISLPGKHSFLYYLTHKSISDAICRNAQEPVLILK